MSESTMEDNQSRYDQLRETISTSCQILISSAGGVVKSHATHLLSAVENSPTLLSGINVSDLNLYYKGIVDIVRALPHNDEVHISTARNQLSSTIGTILDLIIPAINKNQEDIRDYIRSTFIEMHSESGRLDSKLQSLSNKISSYENTFSKQSSDVSLARAEALAEIGSLLENFRSTAAEKGKDLVIIDYRDGAAQEREQSIIYRRAAIFFMIISILILAATLFTSEAAEIASIAIIPKLLVSALLSIPAAYFAREASQHRRQQYLYQQYSFNLNALAPFIADFEKEQRDHLKSELARKLFAVTHESGSKEDSYPVNVQEILMLLLNKMEIGTPEKKKMPREDR